MLFWHVGKVYLCKYIIDKCQIHFWKTSGNIITWLFRRLKCIHTYFIHNITPHRISIFEIIILSSRLEEFLRGKNNSGRINVDKEADGKCRELHEFRLEMKLKNNIKLKLVQMLKDDIEKITIECNRVFVRIWRMIFHKY